ncbi:MAG: glycine oxidase ThiO [Gammaproteobacteria bacterium]|nr:MAG: glycine oxidase ThiO [Gammaproteobacteria bacterium]
MSDVVVIGAGVIGMMTARDLALRGARVTLLERGCAGEESSWAGGGILSALIPWRAAEEINQLIVWGHDRYPQLAQVLSEETGIDVQWCQSGMGVLVSDTIDAIAWSQRFGLQVETLTSEQAASQMTGIVFSDDAQSMVYLPEVAQLRNPRLVEALLSSLDGLGVTVYEHCPVKSIERSAVRITAVKAADATFSADSVVVAAGAWAAQLVPELLQKGIKPMRGEMVLYKAEPGLLSSIIVTEDGYLIPRKDGHILCGSTVDDVEFDCSTTKEALARLSLRAERLLPSLKTVPIVGHWAGLRPGSSTGIPIIGRSIEQDNLFVNCGHFRNGIAMAPASAQLMADLVEGVEPSISSEPYALV